MLATLLIWTYSLTVFYLYGLGILRLVKSLFRLRDDISTIPFPIIVITGMALITTFASYLSLLIPLAGLAVAIVLAGGILIAVRIRLFLKLKLPPFHFLTWILFFLAGLTLLENSTHSPNHPDTGLYHAQAIRWIETYRVVPGLANLHNRLALNSSWLVLNAAFSFAFTGVRSFHLSNSVLLLLALVYFGGGLENLLRGRVAISNIAKGVFFLLTVYFYTPEASSPSTDPAATLLVWLVTALAIEKLEKHGADFNLHSSVIYLLSIYAVTVKLSVFPLAGFAGLVALQRIRDRVQMAALGGMGLIILLPWFLRSIILSGYLIFPLPQIDIFTFDWKFPPSGLAAMHNNILWFARFPNKHWAEHVNLSFIQWVPLWFGDLTRNQKILVLLAAGSPLATLGCASIDKRRELPSQYHLVWLINYVGVIFWLITAPAMRFGYGFLMASILTAILPYLAFLLILIKPVFSLASVLMIVTAILFQGVTLLTSIQPSALKQRLLLPADYLPSRAVPCPIRNGFVFCGKERYLCHYGNFPCIPAARPNVEMRGSSFQNGFRYVP